MTNTPEFLIRETVAAYLAGEVEFGDFERSVLERGWSTDDHDAAELMARIELSLAEYTGGYLDEAGLREDLLPIATKYRAHAGSQVEQSCFDTVTPAAA